jgi:pentatricopeptide repeat protein
VFFSFSNDKNLTHLRDETIVDVENKVSENLNVVGRWPVTVFRSTGDVMEYNLFASDKANDKHFSYILVVSCKQGKWEEACDYMRQMVMELKTSPAWNSRGKFLVAVCNCGADDIQNGLNDLLESLCFFKVFNVLVLYPSSPRTVEIYTWFPHFLPSARCGQFLNVVQLDTWVQIQDTGFFLRNMTLYTEKIPRNLHGCILRASAIKFHPYVICDENGTVEGGIDVHALRTVSEKLNASVELRIPPGKERKGQLLPNGTWTGLKADLIYDKADIIIGCLLINSDDHMIFDDTSVYHSDRFTWIVARATPYPRWLSVSRVFTPLSWLLLFVSVLIFGFIMKYLPLSKYSESNSEWGISKCILTVWAAFLEASVPEMPRGNTLRVLFLSWVIYSLAINTIYQAFFTSYEVDPGLHHQIDTIEELMHTSVVFAFSSPLDPFFTDDMLKRLTPRVRCDPTKCLDYVATVYNATTFIGRVLLGYHREELLKKENRHEVHPFRQDSFQLHAVMLLQKGSPFLLEVNEIISRIVEAGLVDHWEEAIIEERRLKAGILALESLKDSYVELNILHLQGAFIFLFIGIAFSFIAFLAELFFGRMLPNIVQHKE